MNVTIRVTNSFDVICARDKVIEVSGRLGFNALQKAQIASATLEVARNIVQHAGEGSLTIKNNDDRIIIEAIDEGENFFDVEWAILNGNTTNGGLGVGLGRAKQLMDTFDIESTIGSGTTVTITKFL